MRRVSIPSPQSLRRVTRAILHPSNAPTAPPTPVAPGVLVTPATHMMHVFSAAAAPAGEAMTPGPPRVMVAQVAIAQDVAALMTTLMGAAMGETAVQWLIHVACGRAAPGRAGGSAVSEGSARRIRHEGIA